MASDDAGRRQAAAPDLLWGARADGDGAAPTPAVNGVDRVPAVADDPWSEVWPEPEPAPAPGPAHAPRPSWPASEPAPAPAPRPAWREPAAPAAAPHEGSGRGVAQEVPSPPVVRAPVAASAPPAASSVAPRTAPEAPLRRRRARSRVPSGERAEWVLHRVRVWSVAKLAFCVYLFLFAVVLGASAVLWWVATSAGLVHNVEKFLRDIGFTNFQFRGRQLFEGEAIIGGVGVVVFTLLTALAMAVVNVISELSGGLRLVITERRRKPPRRRRKRSRRS